MFSTVMDKKLVIASVIVLALFAGAYYAIQDVKQITVEGVEVSGLRSISLRSFTIEGNIYVNNPSMFNIPVERFDYYIVLEDTNEVISSGELPDVELNKESLNTVEFTHIVEWMPTIDLAFRLVQQEQVNVIVKGNFEINFLGINKTIPFERKFDIRDYLVQFANEKLQEAKEKVVSKVLDFLG